VVKRTQMLTHFPHPLETKNYETFRIGDTIITDAKTVRPALPGDLVSLDDSGKLVIERRTRHTGLVGTIEMGSAVKYGFTSRGTPIYLFVPWNESYPPFYVGSSNKSKENMLAIVDYESWDKQANCPRGACRTIIGPCGDLAAEQAALVHHASPHPWKKSLLPPTLFPRAVAPPDTTLLFAPTFHVDPPGCKDIDDALTLVVQADGQIAVHIHIADVATLLGSNESLWRAAEIGQTLYTDGRVQVGLFPPLVEESLSLIPGLARPTLTLRLLWDPATGLISRTQWQHAQIIVKDSFTYESVVNSDHAPLLQAFCVALGGPDTTDSHEWIAQTMLYYNRAAASIIREARTGVLRCHSAPQQAVLDRISRFSTVPNFLAYSSGAYCAADTTGPTEHWGLGAALYCHASSPIRRFADCINQTSMMNALFGYGIAVPTHSIDDLNAAEKAVKSYERDLFFVRRLLTLGTGIDPESGVIVDMSGEKVSLWVEPWKRIVRVRRPLDGWGFEPTIGLTVVLKAHANYTKRNWKRRLTLCLAAV
jgi:exoribonuclease R